MILKDQEELARKTKIICTAGPACWSEEGLGKLLDAGCNVLRFNFSHGDHDGHYSVLERFRKVRGATASVVVSRNMRFGAHRGDRIRVTRGMHCRAWGCVEPRGPMRVRLARDTPARTRRAYIHSF